MRSAIVSVTGDNTSESDCTLDLADWDHNIEQLYTWLYTIILFPGLLCNSVALWVLCRFIRKKTKAVIFMINLAVADLLHVLSLPLRIYYYFTHTWPFGHALCLLCFYLKYLNMYASIAFLVCISIQRCAFLMHPFCAKGWKRRYDVRISATVWLVVGLCCLPFILMRSDGTSASSSASSSSLYNAGNSNASSTNTALPLQQGVSGHALYTNGHSHVSSHGHGGGSNGSNCFKDLPMRKLDLRVAAPMIAFAEFLGFVLPLTVILVCSCLIRRSLRKAEQHAGDNRRALRMVLVCTGVFLVCFAPYHVNFLLYMMASQGLVTNCDVVVAVRRFHPVTLCIASLNCCLNPLIYYFLTAEFREQLARRSSSVLRGRLMSFESGSSTRD
ncbi:putative P2Y purinoceptor 10 [Engraulis encrasicolus]|uniref:putative P2Y purinoceptor 10 n=1 Tax=Engraulis encrasicolus TaxID=184585 RepID=UPI002FD00A01